MRPEDGTLTFRDTKNGTDHTLRLPNRAFQLLQVQRGYRLAGNDHVFPATRGSGSSTTALDAWDAVKEAADLSDIVLHDLRRTASTWARSAGVSELAIDAMMNHTTRGVRGRYARSTGEDAVPALNDVAQAMAKVEAELAARSEGRYIARNLTLS